MDTDSSVETFNNLQPHIHTRIHSYLAEVDKNHQSLNWNMFGFSFKSLNRRITQKLIFFSYPHLMNSLMNNLHSDNHLNVFIEKESIQLKLDNVSKFSVSSSVLLTNIFEHLKYVLYIWVGIFRSFFIKNSTPNDSRYSLLTDIAPESFMEVENINTQLEDFFQNGQIPILRENSVRYLIKSKYNFKSKSFEFSKDPYWEILSDKRITFFDRLSILINTKIDSLKFLCLSLKHPEFSYLFKDIAFLCLIKKINDRNLIKDVIFTNSDYLTQEIWLSELPHQKRSFTTHMIWYSANSIGLDYKKGPHFVEYPTMGYTYVDEHWVWNEEQKQWLGKLIESKKIHVSGPMMWYLPTLKSKPVNNIKKVIIFDVTPLSKEFVLKHFSQAIYHYYKEETMMQFLNDILDSLKSFNCQLSLKSKRDAGPFHAKKYSEHLLHLETSKKIILLPPKCNIFDQIISSDLCIVIPYTSPAYIAEVFEVKTIYYDPLNIINFEDRKKFSKGHFVQCKKELENIIQKSL